MNGNKSYWNKCGAHQAEQDRLYGLLVPSQGRAHTMHGNLLRCMNNLYYDLYNNGLCNADTQKIQGAALFLLEFEDEIKAKLGDDKGDLQNLVNWVKRQGERGYCEGLLGDAEALMERVMDAVVCVVSDVEKASDRP